MKITKLQIAAVWSIASQVYSGQLTVDDGVLLLSNDSGLNEGSARCYIYLYKCLREGKRFHFQTTELSMRYIMEQIFHEYGKQGLLQALTALRGHIEFNELQYTKNMKRMKKVAEDFEALMKRNTG
jgi:hypothetical protein